jgi:hypothetical protein
MRLYDLVPELADKRGSMGLEAFPDVAEGIAENWGKEALGDFLATILFDEHTDNVIDISLEVLGELQTIIDLHNEKFTDFKISMSATMSKQNNQKPSDDD